MFLLVQLKVEVDFLKFIRCLLPIYILCDLAHSSSFMAYFVWEFMLQNWLQKNKTKLNMDFYNNIKIFQVTSLIDMELVFSALGPVYSSRKEYIMLRELFPFFQDVALNLKPSTTPSLTAFNTYA